MPIYEYQCEKCGFHFDKLQNLSAAPLVQCPECHAATLKKLVSAPSFKLKGSGWYETDFKNKKPAAENKKNTAAKKTTEDGKSQSKDNAKDKKKATTTEKSET